MPSNSVFDHQMNPLNHTLARIADALETIAADITKRKEAEQTALLSQLVHLEQEADRAGQRFSSADRAQMYREMNTPEQAEYIRYTERAMNDAYAALEAFKAAHPELEQLRQTAE